MRIGIDIDDTITDSWEAIRECYSRIFNIPLDILEKRDPYYYSIKDKITIDKYYKMMKPLCDSIIPNVKLKDNVKEILDKLHEEGNQIIFITARGIEYTNAYKTTKEYLDKHKIKYDKIIINSKDKAKICEEELIDLFIDDSYYHCQNVSKNRIDVLMYNTNYNKKYQNIKRINSWLDIYKYINSKGDINEKSDTQ